jgi:hypothetical protein
MKAYERRATGAYPYFKVDTYDAQMCLWRPNKVSFPSEEAARAWCAKGAGQYRLVCNDGRGLKELEPFIVEPPPAKRKGSASAAS